jgi:uncharacterized protein (DUF305 family)
MIRHHQSGIKMAEDEMANGTDTKLKKIHDYEMGNELAILLYKQGKIQLIKQMVQ